jgi:predicted HD phosphohydrolase
VHGEQARHGAESRKGGHRIDGQFAAHGVEALSGEKVTSKEYKFQP